MNGTLKEPTLKSKTEKLLNKKPLKKNSYFLITTFTTN